MCVWPYRTSKNRIYYNYAYAQEIVLLTVQFLTLVEWPMMERVFLISILYSIYIKTDPQSYAILGMLTLIK